MRIASIVLAGLTILVVLLWIRSLWAIDVIGRQSGSTIKGINSSNGILTLVFAQNLSDVPGTSRMPVPFAMTSGLSYDHPKPWVDLAPTTFSWPTLGFNHRSFDSAGLAPSEIMQWVEFAVPHWIVALCLALFPGRRLLLYLKKRRKKVGHCSKCFYDLRAHNPGGKCPECGTTIPAKNSATINGD